MLATVAELSMYQASAMKLENEKQERDKILQEAQERMASGKPPTDDAEEEWRRKVRQEEQKSQIDVFM